MNQEALRLRGVNLKLLTLDELAEHQRIYTLYITDLRTQPPSSKRQREIEEYEEQKRVVKDLIEKEVRRIRESEIPFTD